MLRSFRVGKLFGIPLYLHSTLFLVPALALLLGDTPGLGDGLLVVTYVAALFGCVVLHELGHALMARVFGIGTESITLYPIGGVARLERMSEKPGEEIWIALAGPAVNLVLAVLLAPVAMLAAFFASGASSYSPLDLVAQFAFLLCWGNVALMLFNLLPCFPMDGGRVLRALLAFAFGRLRATEIATRVGLFMAFLIVAAAVIVPVSMGTPLNPMPIVVAMFVVFAGQYELWGVRQLEARRRLIPPIPQEELGPVPTEPRSHPDVPFSGVAWDNRYRVWVRWVNGQPVAYWG
jgi:Zn-dependent protease